jgi:transposase-like protein
MDRKQEKSNNKFQRREKRSFSVELKKKLVEQIELKRLKVKDVVSLYRVTDTSVYRWLDEYSTQKRTGARMVVESESQESKIDKLMKRIAELERSVGKKQLEIEFLDKVVEICSDELGYDVKKKATTMQSSGID